MKKSNCFSIMIAIMVIMVVCIAHMVIADTSQEPTPPPFISDTTTRGETQADMDSLISYTLALMAQDDTYSFAPLPITDPLGLSMVGFGQEKAKWPLFIFHGVERDGGFFVITVEHFYVEGENVMIRICFVSDDIDMPDMPPQVFKPLKEFEDTEPEKPSAVEGITLES